jgi:hypothetical protein
MHWSPDVCGQLSFSDICNYWWIWQNKLKLELDMTHDIQDYCDKCILTKEVLAEQSAERLKKLFNKE